MEGLESVCIVSGLSLEGVWKVIGSFLGQVEIQYKLNSCKYHLAILATNLIWGFTKIKMKTYTWNSSVALLSPTCLHC